MSVHLFLLPQWTIPSAQAKLPLYSFFPEGCRTCDRNPWRRRLHACGGRDGSVFSISQGKSSRYDKPKFPAICPPTKLIATPIGIKNKTILSIFCFLGFVIFFSSFPFEFFTSLLPPSSGLPLETKEDLIRGARTMLKKGVGHVIVTLGGPFSVFWVSSYFFPLFLLNFLHL